MVEGFSIGEGCMYVGLALLLPRVRGRGLWGCLFPDGLEGFEVMGVEA